MAPPSKKDPAKILTVISLCDYSGRWAKPWADAGHSVILVDPKHDYPEKHRWPRVVKDGMTFAIKDGMYCWKGTVSDLLARPPIHRRVDVILAAPPCTHFSSSGARWWREKDADGRTDTHVHIVRDILALTDRLKPQVWALENPVGRINKLVPELGEPLMRFHPHEFAGWADDPQSEAYTKKTCLYGRFHTPLTRKSVEPIYYNKGGTRGSWMWATLGGKSERTKELRSNTPEGFARAFYQANCEIAMKS